MHTPRKAAPLLGLSTLVMLGLTAALPRPTAAQVKITASITGTAPSLAANQDAMDALNFLASDFQTNGTPTFAMTVSIQWTDLGFSSGGYVLGGSFASDTFYQTHNGALVINPLDRYLNGAASTVNTGPGYADFTIELNSNPNVPWDYTLGVPSDGNNISLASVLYHESIHSMGFGAFNNADGSYAFGSNGGNGPLTPTLWDTDLYDGTTQQAFTADTQAQRAAVMVSGDGKGDNGQLFFIGAKAEAANGGQPVAMYAPSIFEPGSSDGSHIAPGQGGASLLYPAFSSGIYLTPSPLELAMMQDIGWHTVGAPVPEASSSISLGILLALSLGGVVVARKRKAAGKAA